MQNFNIINRLAADVTGRFSVNFAMSKPFRKKVVDCKVIARREHVLATYPSAPAASSSSGHIAVPRFSGIRVVSKNNSDLDIREQRKTDNNYKTCRGMRLWRDRDLRKRTQIRAREIVMLLLQSHQFAPSETDNCLLGRMRGDGKRRM